MGVAQSGGFLLSYIHTERIIFFPSNKHRAISQSLSQCFYLEEIFDTPPFWLFESIINLNIYKLKKCGRPGQDGADRSFLSYCYVIISDHLLL